MMPLYLLPVGVVDPLTTSYLVPLSVDDNFFKALSDVRERHSVGRSVLTTATSPDERDPDGMKWPESRGDTMSSEHPCILHTGFSRVMKKSVTQLMTTVDASRLACAAFAVPHQGSLAIGHA